MDFEYFRKRLEQTRKFYDSQKTLYNPYLKSKVILNSDGFHHLRFSARRERSKEEQLLKFSLLPLAFSVIKNSGTLQEYRKDLLPIGKRSKNGFRPTKEVQYWGFIAIVGSSQIKIRVILRQVGDGNIIFWSVMPYSKLRRGERQKIYTENIEDE